VTYKVKVTSLVDPLSNALKVIGYDFEEITLAGQDNFNVKYTAPDGMRGFTCMVHMESGNYKLGWGSRSDMNGFHFNSVDRSAQVKSLDPDIALIKGIMRDDKVLVAGIILNTKLFDALPGAKESKEKDKKKS
jgi:hypothetical protein